MIGTKLHQKKSQAYVLLSLYGLLAVTGGVLAALSISNGQNVSGAAGFMVIFGLGMAVNTLIRSRKAQVSVYEDFLEIDQSRTVRTLRYRNITGVSRPDKRRMIITLREDGAIRNEVVWLNDLEPADVERLGAFLAKAKGKGK